MRPVWAIMDYVIHGRLALSSPGLGQMIANWLMIAALALGQVQGGSKGHLVILGGGALGEEVRRSILDLAGGPKARVVVVPQAANDPEGALIVAKRWQQIGAKHVEILDLSDSKEAIKAIEAADLIWFRGG